MQPIVQFENGEYKMIRPGSEHPDYKKNVKKLEAEGYRFPKVGELPAEIEMLYGEGAESWMIGKKGDIKSVSQSTGEISVVLPPRTLPTPQKPRPPQM